MRSKRAFIGAAAVVLSYPLAVVVATLFGEGGDTVIHFMMGAGFIIFATGVFDFDLPRWINVVGAAAAAAFGTIFLLQGVSDLTQLEELQYLAFDVLGHEVERLLPDVVYLWFVGLLLVSSQGKSRTLGWLVMSTVVGLEIATMVSILIGSPMDSVKVLILLPFIWVLFESAKRPALSADRPAAPQPAPIWG